jgi:hypothetical protein
VTIASRPSNGAGRGKLVKVICPTAQVQYFRVKAGSPNQLEWIYEFAFLAQPIEKAAAADRPPKPHERSDMRGHGE